MAAGCSDLLGDVATTAGHSFVRRRSGVHAGLQLGGWVQGLLRGRPALCRCRRRQDLAAGTLLRLQAPGRTEGPGTCSRRRPAPTRRTRRLRPTTTSVPSYDALQTI